MRKYLVITEEPASYSIYEVEAKNNVEATAIFQSSLGGEGERIVSVFPLDGSGNRLVAAIKKPPVLAAVKTCRHGRDASTCWQCGQAWQAANLEKERKSHD